MFTERIWYVYIIQCKNNRYYTGCTANINVRYEQHLSGQGSAYTKKYGAKALVYVEGHDSLDAARYRERQIKGWSQKKKQNLIQGKWKSAWW